MTDDFIGQTLGQYRIEAPLGSGGMGQVYRGVHRLLNRPAAIKVMQAHLAANPDFRARFLREAQSAAALKHSNIVEIYDFGEQDGHLYLVMELMTDGSLHTPSYDAPPGNRCPSLLGLISCSRPQKVWQRPRHCIWCIAILNPITCCSIA